MGPYRKGAKNFKSKKKNISHKSHDFQGNQHTAESSSCSSFSSKSAKKLSNTGDFQVKRDDEFSYCILGFSLVFSTLSNMVKCKTCNNNVDFTKTGVRGLGFKINIACDCGNRTINSSKLINKSFEINRRIVFIMRLLGVGRNGLDLFCSFMDLTSGFTRVTYYGLLKNVCVAAKAVANICLRKAGVEEKAENRKNNLPENKLTVSGDGTWSKRGFSSLLGVTTVIGKYTGKILDFFVLAKSCKTCEIRKKKMNSVDFEIWYDSEHSEHCSANYEGSSGGMEVQGIEKIFKNSIALHNAMYAYYIGDGDSKTFTNLLQAKPYGELIIQKLECVLHVGKRMFRHLKDVKKSLAELRKFKKADEKKKEQPKNKENVEKILVPVEQAQKKRKSKNEPMLPPPPKTIDLTAKVMKQISINYGLAIKRFPNSVPEMKREIWAGFYHMISTDDAPQHDYCNRDWCKYLKAQEAGGTYKHKPALNAKVQELLKPVFGKLTNEELLTRCLGNNTLNNNECYNKTLWAIVPKHTYVGKTVVQLGVHISSAIFNEGRMTLLKMMEIMGCTIGHASYQYAIEKDEERISKAEKATKAATKDGRMAKKQGNEIEEEAEQDSGVLLYGPGIAD